MTSTAATPNTNPAPNSNNSTNAPSYASAAGATKKPAAAPPIVASGSTQNPPAVVGSANSTAQQHGTSDNMSANSDAASVAAKPAAGPAVVNGSAPEHSRNNSVTIGGNATGNVVANGSAAGNGKSKIQFGGFSDSPAPQHSQPQNAQAAPIAVPGAKVQSPSHSPLPIPQPAMSGGKPGATDNSFKIGSFTGDGDRQRPAAVTQNSNVSLGSQPNTDFRRNSNANSDMGNPMAQGPMRGGFVPQGGRGRAFTPQQQYNQQMGFPPPNGNAYPRGPAQARGGMQQNNYGRGGMGFQGSPRGSPAPQHLNMHHTPTMGQAMPVPPPMNNFGPQYGPPMSGGYQPVNDTLPVRGSFIQAAGHKRNKRRQDSEKFSQPRQQQHGGPAARDLNKKSRGGRFSERRSTSEYDAANQGGGDSDHPSELMDRPSFGPPWQMAPPPAPKQFDLTPGNFGKVLTELKPHQGMYGYDPSGRPMSIGVNGQMVPMGMPTYPPQNYPGGYGNPQQAPQFYPGAPYPQQNAQAQPMSRNNSQVSERPASSTGPSQPPAMVGGTPQMQDAKPQAPPVVSGSSSTFQRPRKSAAIVIKDSSGKALDFKSLAAPASPATSTGQSKTPPAVASTPTPPPAAASPAQLSAQSSHTRSESVSKTGKSSDEVKNEFLKRVKESAGITAEPRSEEKETPAEAEEKAAEPAPAVTPADKVEAKEETAKPAEETSAKTEPATASAAAPAAEEPAEAKGPLSTAPDALPGETEDEYEDRMIREMEEEDARREAAQAEITAKKNAEKEAAKAKAEADKKAAAPADSAENDRKLQEQEREMERLEELKEKQREEERKKAEGGSTATSTTAQDSGVATPTDVTERMANLNLDNAESVAVESAPTSAKSTTDKRPNKPAALNLAPINTKAVEAPQPSAALMSLKSARFLSVRDDIKYPSGIQSPNPALNAAVTKKGKTFKYDAAFLMQFQKVFTEQPSLEFGQQVKSLIGDSDGSRSAAPRSAAGGSGRQPSRGGNAFGAGGAMGAFGQGGGGKTLPPGTTSAERFAMSSRPGAPSMASFSRPGGSFPGGAGMARVPSTTNMGMPNSPRQGSKRGPASSRRGVGNVQEDAKANRAMPLTQGMDIKPIAVTATGWKPTNLGSKAGQNPVAGAAQGAHLDPPTVQRKVKAALNKMTPENFDKISDQILTIAAQSKDEQDGRTLRQVIQLTFEKATDEAHWSSMYAKFCQRMHEMMGSDIKDTNILDKNGAVVSGGALFRKYLLNRCQEEFMRGWKTELPEAKEGESKEAVMLSDEYYEAAKAKRQGLGLIQFIGELYKLGMLTERIMHECLRRLLDFQGVPDEAEIESLTKLLRTVGANLDSEKGKQAMDAYFSRLSSIIEIDGLNSRLKFMLMDIVDLRRKGWEGKEVLKGPKTLDEIRAEAEVQAAQKAAEAARANIRNSGGGGRMGGRGDARNMQPYQQQPNNQMNMDDLRRLTSRGVSSRAASGPLGPSLMLTSRSSSGRRLGPGGALSRGNDDSAASSRNATPPATSSNAFAALAMDPPENATSPPSTAASPALAKAAPATAASEEKKD